MPGDDKQIDTDDNILICIIKDYKSISEVAEETKEPRNKVQVHMFKLRKWKQVVRVMNNNGDQGVMGWKYRANYQTRMWLIKKYDIKV